MGCWGLCGVLTISVVYDESYVTRSRYLRQGQVITSRSLLRDIITSPCLGYLLMPTKSFYDEGDTLPLLFLFLVVSISVHKGDMLRQL